MSVKKLANKLLKNARVTQAWSSKEIVLENPECEGSWVGAEAGAGVCLRREQGAGSRA